MKGIFNFFKEKFNMIAVRERKEKLDIANIKPEYEELCEECSAAAKKHNITKEKTRKMLKEIRKQYNI